MTTKDPAAVLAVMAQEADQSAASFDRMASRQPDTPAGRMNAKRAREDAIFYRARADACRTGVSAIAMAKEPAHG